MLSRTCPVVGRSKPLRPSCLECRVVRETSVKPSQCIRSKALCPRVLPLPVVKSGTVPALREQTVCAAATVTAPEEPRKESWLRPFKDPTSNSRLLALCFAQALCSVATLIHDTYLPVYLSDVLKLSNTKVSASQPLVLLKQAHCEVCVVEHLRKCSVPSVPSDEVRVTADRESASYFAVSLQFLKELQRDIGRHSVPCSDGYFWHTAHYAEQAHVCWFRVCFQQIRHSANPILDHCRCVLLRWV